MSVEFLERKLQAIGNVLDTYRAFQSALRELPPEWAREFLDGLGDINLPLPPPDDRERKPPAQQNAPLETPTLAVLNLLTMNPEGMRPAQIVKELRGRIRTTSENPSKLLYSVLAMLRRSGKVVRTADKRHRLAAYAEEAASEAR